MEQAAPMKILHTSDLHLCEGAAERWAALDELTGLARRRGASVLAIAGDLFDQHADAALLRPRLRDIFSGGGFSTVILPGNHDYRAYRSGLFFGEGVRVIRHWREPVEAGGIRFWGMPYEPLSSAALALRLRELSTLIPEEGIDILLYHGELLDAFYAREDLGGEGPGRYMPARLDYFRDLPVSAVLAGHFHSRFTAWELSPGRFFVYPGSPVAVTRRETGPRKVHLWQVGASPEEIALDTFHFVEERLHLDPFASPRTDPVALLRRRLANLHPQARLLLTVEGFYNGQEGGSEEELVKSLQQAAGEKLYGEPEFSFMDIGEILEDPLFRLFHRKLAATDYPGELKERIQKAVIRAMMEVRS